MRGSEPRGPSAEIATARCRIRPLAEGDRADVLALYRDERVRRYLGGPLRDERLLAERFEGLLAAAGEGGCGAVRMAADGSFAGLVCVGLHHNGRDVEVSYQFRPDRWGAGLAQEAVGAVIPWAARRWGLGRIVAETQEANRASRRLLDRLGMKPVARLTRFGAAQVIYAVDTPEAGPRAPGAGPGDGPFGARGAGRG